MSNANVPLDLIKYSVPMLYSRNKNRAYRESIVCSSTALLAFMKREHLLHREPFDTSGALKMDLELRLSDLSALGVALFEKAIPAWLRRNDTTGKHTDVSPLEQALAQLRATQG